ncbi:MULTISPECIES: biliverdin-producing heme oxygenase [Acinetobacter]|uniref:Biliverdin-producing heme oxygenase n=1 Tax=Acinetobacter guerrae TaxID=1843371 RepID=A0A3A8ERI6_9GAMM|nr:MULTISPECIES: biliverdin-producing heme oxygenase [Acinetobacter]MPW43323.1 heme oxygenase [Acinetobacter guerrae]RKG31023.1 biliverdin-producing heme oxygenase [Acinetobacter guerrae]
MNQSVGKTDIQHHISSALSLRLKTETAAEHERMHHLMAQADVFASRMHYAKFTLAQYYFQRDVEYLFKYPEIIDFIPDLDVRGRSDAAFKDLQDLGVSPTDLNIASQDANALEALGWIYVSEGSTLGAAFLFKEAKTKLELSEEFGARNLAAYPEGRAKVWKRFVQALDDAGLSQTEQDQVVQGAMDGFARFASLLTTANTDQ